MKDYFSERSGEYAHFRPGYPQTLIDFILSQVSHRDRAWDCGTGNGQVAGMLAPHFKEIIGTDISANQLQHAVQADNIHYVVQEAGASDFPSAHFDLITVAQAIHWFPFAPFYADVHRTLKSDGLFVVTGYQLPEINHEVDKVVYRLYEPILGQYWDPERSYVDEGYNTIPFPFQEISTPQLTQTCNWKIDQLCGFLSTWSALKHYRKANNTDALQLILPELEAAWGGASSLEVRFPVLLRAGRKFPT